MKLNSKGFTLVEMLAVVALLGLLIGIATPNIMKSQKKAKERLLSSKVKNIEKAAVLWGQDNKTSITEYGCTDVPTNPSDPYGKSYECYSIQVAALVFNKYMEGDDGSTVENPVSGENMNQCYISVYKKYGKIYAIYNKSSSSNCWVVK